MKNILIIVEAFFGTVFLIFGVVTMGRDNRTAWLYLVVATVGSFSATCRNPA